MDFSSREGKNTLFFSRKEEQLPETYKDIIENQLGLKDLIFLDCADFKKETDAYRIFLPHLKRIDAGAGFHYLEHLLLSGKTLVLYNYEKGKSNQGLIHSLVQSQSNHSHAKGQCWVILIGSPEHMKKQSDWFFGRITVMKGDAEKIDENLLQEWIASNKRFEEKAKPKREEYFDNLKVSYPLYRHSRC